MIVIKFGRKRRGKPLFRERLDHNDDGASRSPRVNFVADSQGVGRFGIASTDFDVASGTGLLRQSASLEEPGGPEPFINSYRIHGRSFWFLPASIFNRRASVNASTIGF